MRRDEIYEGGYEGYDQLDPADSLAGEIGEDPLDAGYSPPDRPPRATRRASTYAELWGHTPLDERLAEEEPDVGAGTSEPDGDFDMADEDPRAGRLVAPDQGGLADNEATEIAEDVGRAGWAASAEEAAVHVIPEPD